MADARVGQQLQHRIHHAQARAQDRHDDHVGRQRFALGRLDRCFDARQRHRQLAGGLNGQEQTEPMRQPAEVAGCRRPIAQRRQGILRDRVLHQVYRHGRTIHASSRILADAETARATVCVCSCPSHSRVRPSHARRRRHQHRRPPVRRVSLIVTGGTVVTMDAAGTVIENGAVAIADAAIVAVGTAADVGLEVPCRAHH